MPSTNRQRFFQYFFFAVFLILIYQLLRILSHFLVPILGSAILALMFYPLHAWILNRVRNYPNYAAIFSTAAVVLIVVLPLLLFGWVFLKESAKVYPDVKLWIENAQTLGTESSIPSLPQPLLALWTKAQSFLEFWNIDLQEIVLNNLEELRATVTLKAAKILKNTLFVIFDLLVLAFTLFFCFRDGPSISGRLIELIPMEQNHKKAIVDTLLDTLFAVIRGILATAAAQGFLAGVGFAIAGARFPVLLGFATTFFSPIPFVGTMGIWLPVVLYMFLLGKTGPALFLLLWSTLVVGLIDNLIRPLVIGAHTKIPILLIFFGLLGGLRTFGFMGLLLGPILIALVLAFVKIYRTEYRWHETVPEP